MRAYIIKRLLLVIPTLFILTVIVFLLVRFLPGNVIDLMEAQFEELNIQIDRESFMRMLGLDVPVHVQYGRWIGDIFRHGTLGESLLGGLTVEEKILARLPVTLELGVIAIVIGLVIALPIGIYSAIRQDTVADYAGRSIAIIGLATPNFWLGIMVMTYPAIWWGWSPPMACLPMASISRTTSAIPCQSVGWSA
jgi:peptide/nickel transport system permease protein